MTIPLPQAGIDRDVAPEVRVVEGVAALAKGEKIHYEGASGPITLDRYHNREPGYVLSQLTPGGVKDLRLVPNSIVRKLEVGQHATVG
jgi:hypothetical protein